MDTLLAPPPTTAVGEMLNIYFSPTTVVGVYDEIEHFKEIPLYS